jgi:hypothetical protein
MSSSMHQKKSFMNTYSLLPARLKYKDLTHLCDCMLILVIDYAVQLPQCLLVLSETLQLNSVFLDQTSITNVKQIQALVNTLYQLMHV